MTETTKTLTKREQARLEVIFLVAKTNPKKKPSMSYDRFENYFTLDWSKPVTVDMALKAGVRMDDIRHDSEHGFIILGEKNIEAAKKKAEADEAAEIERMRKKIAEIDAANAKK